MQIIYMHHANRDMSKGKSQENPITKEGFNEAKAIGELLGIANFSAKCIYTGEFLRYQQTNEQINKYLQVPVIIDKRLNEFDKKTKEETGREYEKRIHQLLDEIIKNHNNDDIIICMTSGIALTCFMSYFIKGKPIKGFQVMYGTTVSPVSFIYNKEGKGQYLTEWN